MNGNRHYRAIAEHYGTRPARRSQVPLIAHIDQGLRILDAIGASQSAKDAFCLHPLLQDDESLGESLREDSIFSRCQPEPRAVVLAMEYRRVANAYLSHHFRGVDDVIELSPLAAVNEMLIADKVQNRKDFEIHHLGKHGNSAVLEAYFDNWLRRLGIPESRYQELAGLLSA